MDPLQLGVALGAALVAAWALARSFFKVEEGTVAVLESFGAALTEPAPKGKGGADGRVLRTFGPGLHRKKPWEHVRAVPMMEQSLELSGEASGQTTMTEDGTVLRFDSILRYQPEPLELEQYLFGLRAPREHITGLFSCLLRNEIANFGQREGKHRKKTHYDDPPSMAPGAMVPTSPGVFSTPDEGGSYALIRRERQLLNEHIRSFCEEHIADTYGVRFNAVDLVDILPPDELAEALNAVMQAQTEADSCFARAQADSRQEVLAAERGVEIAKVRAKAIEAEILTLSKHLGELAEQGTLAGYVARRRVEVLSESRAVFDKRS